MIRIDFRCEVCQGRFNTSHNPPRILPCGHTLCIKCIYKLKLSNSIKCPFDRKQIALSDDIPINYYLLSLLDNSDMQSSFQSNNDLLLHLTPSAVINPNGWEDAIDGFIYDHVLYTIEGSGKVYGTDLQSGEWWLVSEKRFNAKYFLQLTKDTFCTVDVFGNLMLIDKRRNCNQIGRKNLLENTVKIAAYNDSIISIEDNGKAFITELEYGTKKGITVNSIESCRLMISNGSELFIISDKGELRMIMNPFDEDQEQSNVLLVRKYSDIGSNMIACNNDSIFYFDKTKRMIYQIDLRHLMTRCSKRSIGKNAYQNAIFYEMQKDDNSNGNPLKIFCDNDYVVYTNESGNIIVIPMQATKKAMMYQCQHRLRNCFMSSIIIANSWDLVYIDTINMQLISLDLSNGIEKVLCSSNKLLSNIKTLFSVNNTIYLINTEGNLYSLTQYDNQILKQILTASLISFTTFTVSSNHLYTFHDNTLSMTDVTLDHPIINTVKCNYLTNLQDLYSNDTNVFIINSNDEIITLIPKNDPYQTISLEFYHQVKFAGISKVKAKCFYKNHIIYYDEQIKSIIAVNLIKGNDDFLKLNNQVENFPKVLYFVNNQKSLACIGQDGLIYRLQF